MKFVVGDKIYFETEKKPYKIVGCNKRYLVCLKPFNLRKDSYLYTIVDLKEKIRGPDHWVFGKYDYRKPEDIALALSELASEENKISRRRCIKLDIYRHEKN